MSTNKHVLNHFVTYWHNYFFKPFCFIKGIIKKKNQTGKTVAQLEIKNNQKYETYNISKYVIY